MSLHAAFMLAASYIGEDRTQLAHAVSDEPIVLGRVKRDSGEAICSKRYNDTDGNLADSATWIALSGVTCPRCMEILRRYRPDLDVSSHVR